jgi:hypothetical protein
VPAVCFSGAREGPRSHVRAIQPTPGWDYRREARRSHVSPSSNVGWYQGKVREAEKAYMAYREAELGKGRTYTEIENDPEWLKLRLSEICWWHL